MDDAFNAALVQFDNNVFNARSVGSYGVIYSIPALVLHKSSFFMNLLFSIIYHVFINLSSFIIYIYIHIHIHIYTNLCIQIYDLFIITICHVYHHLVAPGQSV